ncbi:unnamed protein product [Onchocerca ochengi]|uniref:ANK_REP_REGION domain-containing protein n=1 Tax=Onchocerca ochengi TaxID=42157 RepID=A0A182EGE7_ONCOC|nr:unnamed protein product [Onchocerca ochengi]
MAKQNDDIISPRLQNGILASALADLQKYDNVTFHYKDNNGTNSIPEFKSNSILVDAANKAKNQRTSRLTSDNNSPLSTYRGIIGTALRNEVSSVENGYIPSKYERQSLASIGSSIKFLPSEKSLMKKPISLNGHKSLTSSPDHTMSGNSSALQSPRYTERHKGNKMGMISKWLQEISESTPDLNNRKEITDALVSPRTGILGLLLKKKKKSREEQTCKSLTSSSFSPDPIASEINSVIKESQISKKNRSLLNLKNPEINHNKLLSLEDLDDISVNRSLISAGSKFSKDQKADYMEWSVQQSTSKETKISHASSMSINEDEYSKSVSSKLLLYAIKGEWTKAEQILNDQENLDFTITDPHGFTVLFHAVKNSNIWIFNHLLNHGAPLNSITKDGRTIAHVAAMFANKAMIQHLLNCKIDFKICETTSNKTPLHFACARASKRGFYVTQVLLRHWEEGRLAQDLQKCLPIHYAVKCGNMDTVQLLLEVDDNNQLMHVDANGDSLLHIACRSGENDMLQLLASYDQIDVNIRNSDGWTVLHDAALKGNITSLRILHKLGANANILDKEDRTPLHIAAAVGHTNVAELLIEKFGGSVRARTSDGSTLLHVAALSGHASTALTFLKHGVPLCMPNRRGALGLHSAAAAGFEDVVQMLIARGTNVDIKTRVISLFYK